MPKRNGSGIALLADPTRRRILAAVALRPRRPSSLAAELDLSRPAMTRQMRLLEDAGLLRESRFLADRRGVLFAIDPRMHGRITAWLAGTEIVRPTTAEGGSTAQGAGLAARDEQPPRQVSDVTARDVDLMAPGAST